MNLPFYSTSLKLEQQTFLRPYFELRLYILYAISYLIFMTILHIYFHRWKKSKIQRNLSNLFKIP